VCALIALKTRKVAPNTPTRLWKRAYQYTVRTIDNSWPCPESKNPEEWWPADGNRLPMDEYQAERRARI
jgi:hypothetical protein